MPIIRTIRFETSGTKNSVSQVFYNNLYADGDPVRTSFSSILKPKFITYGGTLNYLGQDPYAIFTNLVRPPIRFVFSANTASLSGGSYFIHDIYRIDYETFKLYGDNQIDSQAEVINNKSIQGPESTSKKSSKEIINPSRKVSGNNPIIEPEKYFGQSLTTRDLQVIQDFLSKPILTLTASTSAITGNIYDLYIDQYVKVSGRFKSELFLDKAQYFVDTKLITYASLDKNYSDFISLNQNGEIDSSAAWNNQLELVGTNSFPYTVQSGLFSGITLSGNYFTYFVVPDKPVLEYPIMTGTLTTFTPEFRWSNGVNADSFLIQITYDTTDTGFTGNQVFNYPVEKSEKNTKISRSKTKSFDTEFESEKALFTFQVPVKSNMTFLYRIGNSKELIDIFNIRRNVVTFTDYYSATTQPEPIRVYVRTESDSPFSPGTSGFEIPPSLDYESPLESYILSGVVSGSTAVTGATIQLTYPNSSFVIGSTDIAGFFSFSGLSDGIYTVTTNYRGYAQDIRNINITGNTSENIDLELIWGNIYDTWGELDGALFS